MGVSFGRGNMWVGTCEGLAERGPQRSDVSRCIALVAAPHHTVQYAQTNFKQLCRASRESKERAHA